MYTNYYYEVIGNFGQDGEKNGTGYKTIKEAKQRVFELGNAYDSYDIIQVNADDKSDFRIIVEMFKPQ